MNRSEFGILMPREIRVLVAVYLLLGLAFATSVPLWEAPDAIWHYHFAAHLADGHGLPSRADEGLDAPWRQQGSQPPLYYLIAAPFLHLAGDRSDGLAFRENPHHAVGNRGPGGNEGYMLHGPEEGFPWRGTVLAARLVGLVSLGFGLLAVLAGWAGTARLLPSRPASVFAATAILAFNPEQLFFSGAISNDIAAAAAGALVYWRAACLLRPSGPGRIVRDAAWLGLACGIALLAKLNGLWLLPPAGLALLFAIRRDARNSALQAVGPMPIPNRSTLASPVSELPVRAMLRPLLCFSLVTILVSGWWYLRNLILFGDPTGLPLMFSVMTRRTAAPGLRELGMQLWAVWRSYWGVFGWFNVPAPAAWHLLVSAATLIAFAGLGLGLARGRASDADRRAIALSSCFVLTMAAGVVAWAQLQYPQGRLAFPAAPALACLIGLGLTLNLDARPAWKLARVIAVGMAGLSLALLVCTIWPSYRAIRPRPAVASAGSAVLARFGPGLSLSAHLEPAAEHGRIYHAGESIDVDLAWELGAALPRDYSVFFHLLDTRDTIIAQRDSFPQSGRVATSSWHRLKPIRASAGQRFTELLQLGLPPFMAYAPPGGASLGAGFILPDSHKIVIPPTHATDCDCRLIVGLYDPTSGRRLATEQARDHVEIARIRVAQRVDAQGIPNPLDLPFGDRIELAGYALGSRQPHAGETVEVELYWRALGPIDGDYKVSLQLRDEHGTLVGQRDIRPADGWRATTEWRSGEIIEDRHPLEIATTAPPGVYRLKVILYEDETRVRLPVRWREPELDLGPIRVLPPGTDAPPSSSDA